jgi:GTPase SAR1 family protein
LPLPFDTTLGYTNDNVVRILVGNKCDMTDRREVSHEEALELAAQYNMKYVEASAKASHKVTETFELLAADIQAVMARDEDL